MIIGLGIDLVDNSRFDDPSPGLLDRLFTHDEQAYCQSFSNPAPHLAARFAAKEAAMKAMSVGLGAFDFHDVSVVRHDSGAPELIVTGAAARLAQERGITRWLISLSHTDGAATAVVLGQ